jgi:DNA end-binding protein Ku
MANKKSAISVGLIYIPIELQKTTKDISISFNQLTADSHERIHYKKYCKNCDQEVPSENIVKGYEYEKGKYVIIKDEELEAIKSKVDKTIHVLHFSNINDIDTLYYDTNYYVIPSTGAEKAFELLRSAMLSSKKVAIAKTVMGTKEKLIVLSPTKNSLIAKTVFYQEEIQPTPLLNKASVDKNELKMAKTLIDSMTQTYDPTIYYDEYQAKLRQAIELKIHGQEIVSSDDSQPSIINLMDALQQSIQITKQKNQAS